MKLRVRRQPDRLRSGHFRLPGVGSYAACAACAAGRVNPDESIGPIVGDVAELLIGTVIIAFVPWTSIGFR
jgi:hypothetical protein